ncbi:hypothetical protein Tco_0959423, partial [Tanacetum coccineum]
IMEMFDEVQAGIDADALFVAKLYLEEREEYTNEERAKFLAETINIGGYKHSQLKEKTFEEIQKEEVLKEPDSTKIESMNKEDAGSVSDVSNKRKGDGIYYRIFRSDGSSRWIKTFSEMVTRFDRLDLVELYSLVMQRFETITPEGVDLVLWGDLRRMFDANVHTLTLEDGTEIHMLVERKYLLTKETLEWMMSLKLIPEFASDSAYYLLRFIQKQIDEAGSHDGGEKDL